jgi:hypothetical protein
LRPLSAYVAIASRIAHYPEVTTAIRRLRVAIAQYADEQASSALAYLAVASLINGDQHRGIRGSHRRFIRRRRVQDHLRGGRPQLRHPGARQRVSGEPGEDRLDGLKVEREDDGRGHHYQVEQTFATKAAAKAQVAKLKVSYYAYVETDAAGVR